ncbi:MAG: polyphosphate kinase 1 [Leptospiraceae bacterium]|nr:polyphosphate kinase 1 [Leptospiraceae bacterium]
MASKQVKKNNLGPLTRSNPRLFFNRELSWLKFNARVLDEASRKDNPLLERLKFLAIYESNMVEFFMIRVAGLKQVKASEVNEIQMDGRTPLETLEEISRIMHQQEKSMYRYFKDVRQSLAAQDVTILDSHQELAPREKRHIAEYFRRDIFRVLTPMAIDPGHPFPHIINNSFYLAISLEHRSGKDKHDHFAILEAPAVLPRFVPLPSRRGQNERYRFIPIEEIIKLHANELLAGTRVKSIHGFKMIRNNDMAIDEVASDNLLSTIESELRNRRWGEAVSLFYRKGMPPNMREFLRQELDLEEWELYEREAIINLDDLWQIYGAVQNRPELKDRVFIPRNTFSNEKGGSLFSKIREKDILLHHPYDSFQAVTDLLAEAARDPKVLAIKQTLYRTGTDSPVIRSLIEAAENGKQVTAVVELKARFDEERNITWARQMEKHGIHVIYGLLGMKIHGKMLQIIRSEKGIVRSYCHLATGNYNPGTSKIYTDIGLITNKADINTDVTNLFHSLTGYSTHLKFHQIAAAPLNLREKLGGMINREIRHARSGKKAEIIFKMNSLVDPDMILMLYKASRAGVRIRLNIRGICCLRPGIPGLSENIKVVSIVGRFLEHSRIYYFFNNNNESIYLSSADLMPRNLNRRIEVLFPVRDADQIQQLKWILQKTFDDNHNARKLQSDGSYERLRPAKSEQRFSSQRFFREETMKEFERKEKDREAKRRTIFQPVMNPEIPIDPSQAEEHESLSAPAALDAKKAGSPDDSFH